MKKQKEKNDYPPVNHKLGEHSIPRANGPRVNQAVGSGHRPRDWRGHGRGRTAQAAGVARCNRSATVRGLAFAFVEHFACFLLVLSLSVSETPPTVVQSERGAFKIHSLRHQEGTAAAEAQERRTADRRRH
jgi:hypothetical protein